MPKTDNYDQMVQYVESAYLMLRINRPSDAVDYLLRALGVAPDDWQSELCALLAKAREETGIKPH